MGEKKVEISDKGRWILSQYGVAMCAYHMMKRNKFLRRWWGERLDKRRGDLHAYVATLEANQMPKPVSVKREADGCPYCAECGAYFIFSDKYCVGCGALIKWEGCDD